MANFSRKTYKRFADVRVKTGFHSKFEVAIVPHMLRHTCATRLARAGIGMPVIKEWMGHSAIQTTMRYSHFAPSDLARAGELLSRIVG